MHRVQARPVPYGSSTQTLTSTAPAGREPEAGPSRPPDDDDDAQVGRLVLRGGPSRRQRVQWDEGTVDNEGMGKKKSKICCIYRKPRPFDESSSDESETDSDSSCDHDHDHGQRHRRHRPDRPHQGPDDSAREGQRSPEGGGTTTADHRPPAPNAYDAEPSDKGKGKSSS